jgi:hypothetical protein
MAADYLGAIQVPVIATSGAFPLVPDFPVVFEAGPEVYVHRFGLYDAKAEQRFYAGPREETFTIRRAALNATVRADLEAFWIANQGPLGAFTFNAPNADQSTTPLTCHFSDQTITFKEMAAALCSVEGLQLKTIPDPSTAPVWPLAGVCTRFPSSALAAALLNQVQTMVPLVHITPLQAGYVDNIYISNQRCTIGGQLYQARLLDWDGIQQTLGASDEAQFALGNADTVISQLANNVDLFRAAVEFSLYHVESGLRIDLWGGTVSKLHVSPGDPVARMQAADGCWELTLPYPLTRISHTCLKPYNNALGGCDWAARSGVVYTSRVIPSGDTGGTVGATITDTFTPSTASCDHGWDSPNGCLAHGMETRFGGIICNPQNVIVKDNSTGVWGFGRSSIQSVSLVSESLYDEILPEIWYSDIRGSGWPPDLNWAAQFASPTVRLVGSYPGGGTQVTMNGLVANGTLNNGDIFSICYPNMDPTQIGNWFAYTVVGDTAVDGTGEAVVTIAPAIETLNAANWGLIPEYPTQGLQINCKLADGRDESSFYDALGVVGGGPITFADMSPGNCGFSLDGQLPEGFANHATTLPPGGLRTVPGNDPLQPYPIVSGDTYSGSMSDSFSLGDGADGTQWWSDQKCAGLAFVELRRQKAAGFDPSTPDGHSMVAAVKGGLTGYTWTGAAGGGPYTRNVVPALYNPVWVAVNVYLRAKGMWSDPVYNPTGIPSATQLPLFDVDSCIAAAAICDLQVPKIVGLGMETQFVFAGVLQEEKPLRDWLREILNSCLGYFSFSFNQLRIGIRENSSVSTAPGAGAFTAANILWHSLSIDLGAPSFNYLTCHYADRAYNFVANSVVCNDEDNASFLAGASGILQYRRSNISFVGIADMSQAARVGTTRLREELGGINLAEWLAVRELSVDTTVLALGVEPGGICSMTDPNLPDYPETEVYSSTLAAAIGAGDLTMTVALPLDPETVLPLLVVIDSEDILITAGLGSTTLTIVRAQESTTAASHLLGTVVEDPNYQAAQPNYSEFRCRNWKLNKDFSVTISGRTTHNDIYDLTYGPKPGDAVPLTVPVLSKFPPQDWMFSVETELDGILHFQDFACGEYGDAVNQGTFEIYYVKEDEGTFGTIVGGTNSTNTTFEYFGAPPVVGEWIQVDKELMYVKSVAPGSPGFGDVTVLRGQLGTAAASHPRINTTVSAVDSDFPCQLTVDTGLNIHPGTALVLNIGEDPPYPQAQIGLYDPVAGTLITALPITGIASTDAVYTDPRLWRVSLATAVIAFAPGFFSSPSRATFDYPFSLPFAGVVLVRGQLINTNNLQSAYAYAFPVSSQLMQTQFDLPFSPPWPYKLRTYGGHRFLLNYNSHPASVTVEDLDPALPPHAQAFADAYASVSGGETDIMMPPPAAGSVLFSAYEPSGEITIAGSPDSSAQIQVMVAQPGGAPGVAVKASTWYALANGITSLNSPSDVAASLAAWLQADPVWPNYYDTSVSGAVLTITDKTGNSGTLAAVYVGAITTTCSGFTSALGILIGRRYALAYSGGGYRSALSALSKSTGPTGDASQITIQDVAASSDGRVSTVEVYAAPDGADSPFFLVASVSNGSSPAIDTITEADLGGETPYPGETQPGSATPILITLTKNGFNWAELYIPAGASQSNVVQGYTLDPISQNTVLNAKIDNSAGANGCDVAIYIE